MRGMGDPLTGEGDGEMGRCGRCGKNGIASYCFHIEQEDKMEIFIIILNRMIKVYF
jgi:hypothetical protein